MMGWLFLEAHGVLASSITIIMMVLTKCSLIFLMIPYMKQFTLHAV